ncbi:MAG: ABC transporter permease [Acidobacteriota bacterium]
MSLGDLLRFSGGALFGHPLRSVLSLLGMSIGVASVVLLTGLGEGARRYVIGEFTSLGTNLLIVFPGKTETTGGMAPLWGGVPNDLTLDDVEALRRRVPSIRRAAPIAMGEATARRGDRIRQLTVVGTTGEMREIRQLELNIGRFLPETMAGRGPRVCVIGCNVQRELFPEENPLGKILHLGEERFRVIGVLAPRGMSLGLDMDEIVEVPVVRAMRIFDQTTLFRVLIEVRNRSSLDATSEAVVEVLTDRHGEEDVTVVTQDAVISTFDDILRVLTAAIAGIAAISLGVAGIAIMNVMLVSVTERTGEVGLLKALGATDRQVVVAFLAEAALLAFVGGVLGLLLGETLAFVVGLVWPKIEIEAPTWAVLAALLTSSVVGVVFGVLPARRAAALDPVDALARGH